MGAGSGGDGGEGRLLAGSAGSGSPGIGWHVMWRGKGRGKGRRDLEAPRSLAQGAEETGWLIHKDARFTQTEAFFKKEWAASCRSVAKVQAVWSRARME